METTDNLTETRLEMNLTYNISNLVVGATVVVACGLGAYAKATQMAATSDGAAGAIGVILGMLFVVAVGWFLLESER